jgi:hypothetical protein
MLLSEQITNGTLGSLNFIERLQNWIVYNEQEQSKIGLVLPVVHTTIKAGKTRYHEKYKWKPKHECVYMS